MTTARLIDHVREASDVTERELELMSRLVNAIELVEDLTHQIARLECDAGATHGTDP